MEWHTAYILVRVAENGQATIVHTAQMLKDARYWLQYIAQPGDAIFSTPLHPKYTGTGEPLYFAHLVCRGKIDYDQSKWKAQVLKGSAQLSFCEQVMAEGQGAAA